MAKEKKRKPGRPRIGRDPVETINVAVEPTVVDQVEQLAAKYGVSRSEVFRAAIRRYLDAAERKGV